MTWPWGKPQLRIAENAEGARNAPIAKSLEKQGAETWWWKEKRYQVNCYKVTLVNRNQGHPRI
jgi:hypothetical protein